MLMIPTEVSDALLQYGALGAFSVCGLLGVVWYARVSRKDVADTRADVAAMVAASKQSNQAFIDYLIEQSRQARETNASFVKTIDQLGEQYAGLSSRIDKWLGRHIDRGSID